MYPLSTGPVPRRRNTSSVPRVRSSGMPLILLYPILNGCIVPVVRAHARPDGMSGCDDGGMQMSTLVKFNRDWADEFYVSGFKVVDPEEVEEIQAHFSVERTCYFGTNEGWESETLLDAFEFIEISDE